ncbi:hypothetical protein EAG_03688, partial [Camponotus floridanus]
EFLIGLRLVLNSTFFRFNGMIYKQIFSTSMRSPLSPIYADLVLQDLEERAIIQLSFHLPFYLYQFEIVERVVSN